MGLDEARSYSTKTAYTPDDFKQYRMAIEDVRVDFDQVLAFKEPQQKNNNNNNRNNNNQNNRRNRNNRNDDDDYYDD